MSTDFTEDKAMYDAREKAIRDRKWELGATYHEGERKGKIEGKIQGEIEGKVETIRILQGLLHAPLSEEGDLRSLTLEQLQAMTGDLQEKLRKRMPA